MSGEGGSPDAAWPEIRRDPVTGAWSILAAGRARRPGAVPGAGGGAAACPFCPGNESLTPPETYAEGREEGAPDSPGWKVRVVPNLYPALVPEAGTRGWRRGTRRGRPARGEHEVIINSPHHDRSLAVMDAGEAARLMGVYRQRYRRFAALPDVKQVQIVLNHKRESGASLEHPHTQVFVLPVVSRIIADELRETRRSFAGGCILCAAARDAREDGRLIAENDGWAAFAPYASRSAFETWFVPLRHEPDFAAAADGVLEGMADILTRVLGGVAALLGDPAYNLWLHSAPCDGRDHRHYHWHVEMVPRIIITAGFEMATGMYIDIVPPEEAARQLREGLAAAAGK